MMHNALTKLSAILTISVIHWSNEVQILFNHFQNIIRAESYLVLLLGSELGQEIKEVIDQGKLVNTHIIHTIYRQ